MTQKHSPIRVLIARLASRLRMLLPKSAFARGVSVLAGGTAGAQLMTMLAAPILTRLYTPDDIGLLAVYAGILSLISVFSSMRYELAIPLPENDQHAANIVALSLLTVLCTTLLVSLALLLFGRSIAFALSVPDLIPALWLLPVGLLLSGTFTVFSYWAIRTKRFSTIAGTKLRQALATITVQITAYTLGPLALLLAQVVGQSAGTTSLARPALAHPVFRTVTWKGIAAAAIRYRRFPIYNTWAGLFNAGGTHLPPLLFAAFFNAATAGLFSLAHRVTALPLSVIGSAISQVYFAGAAEKRRQGTLAIQVERLQKVLPAVCMPPLLLLFLFGPELFSIVFGSAWREAGEFARWMTLSLYMQACTSPLTLTCAIYEKQHLALLMQAILFSFRAGAILIGVILGDLLYTVILFSSATAVAYLLFLLLILRITGVTFSVIPKSFLISLTLSFAYLSPIWLIEWTSPLQSYNLGLLALSLSALATHYFLLFKKIA